MESRICNVSPCCSYLSYTPWSACNVSCGGGISWRKEQCYCPIYQYISSDISSSISSIILYNNTLYEPADDIMCQRVPLLETQACNTEACCTWSGWQSWSACSLSCGFGTINRQRRCNCPDILDGSSSTETRNPIERCLQASYTTSTYFESSPCFGMDCCDWEWSAWTPCSRICIEFPAPLLSLTNSNNSLAPTSSLSGSSTTTTTNSIETNGVQLSYQTCNCSSGDCFGTPQVSSRPCAAESCCSWGEWSRWSTCAATTPSTITSCTVAGSRQRARLCYCSPTGDSLSIYPSEYCQIAPQIASTDSLSLSPSTEEVSCTVTLPNCCEWSSDWSTWSSCSKTCGGGTKRRSKPCSCTGPSTSTSYATPTTSSYSLSTQSNTNLCTGRQPTESQSCNSFACFSYKW
eukprot:TRINITY_DN6219_c0_g1_i2.p1 TRINITY_DN6219_c0_g1~~TRINITY_DN6219_c0_g1_i2.p1  ORF type:complete len:405 (-),score=23.64 TRINITY_DN6219_c0_g1_i2:111-1325(-)